MAPRLTLGTAALILLAGLTHAQVVAEPDAEPDAQPEALTGQEVQVNEAGLLDIHLRDIPLPDALRLLSQRARRNISVSESVTAHITSDLYQVTFDEALDALLTPGGYVWFPRGKLICVCPAAERDTILNSDRAVELRIFELNHVTAAEAVPIVTSLLGPQGMITNTGPSKVEGVALTAEDFDAALNAGLGGRSRASRELIVVRDFPEVLDEIAAVLNRLDVRPRQVLIEAVILRARLNETNALGIDFNVLAGIDFRTIDATSTGGTNLTPQDVPQPEFDNGLGALETDFGVQVPPGGLSLGVITNNVAMFVRALEETVDLTIVANPKVLTVNEQPGRVIVGRQDGYLTTTVTETVATETVEFIETGTQILFRPFISDDGYVRMDIHPEDSSGGLTPDNLPFKDTTEVTANVLVKDGHTLVIGGLFREVTSATATQIPWFGNLPLIGPLFRGENNNAVREEVIVLITPHIIEGDQGHETAEWMAGEIERWRVMAHRGLMPWGRERLAQAHYGWALEHQRAGRLGSARWDVDLALSLNPRFIEADWLRTELTGRATAEPDSSVVHDLVRELIDAELERNNDTPE